jgi:transcriptional regulator with XRE-family HTH domain
MTDEEILRALKTIRHSSYPDRVRKRSLTMSGLARATGITRENLHNIASGKTSIGPKTRTALREYFGCEVEGGERPDPRPAPVPSVPCQISIVFGPKRAN